MIATEMLRRTEAASQAYEKDLAHLVSIDSGSHDAAGVNRVADWVQQRLEELGFETERRTLDPAYGDLLVGRKRGSGSRRIVTFAHMDTVFERGDAAERPFSIDANGMAHGPGVTDDKAGVIAGLHAAAHLLAADADTYGELVLVFTPDEEIGSPVGGAALQQIAEGADAAFCLECARENGDLVVARKGAVDLEITINGVAAHSGIEPERGAHAGLEAAHLTVFLQALADPTQRLTVNVGMLRAGERINIVPDRATMNVEMRAVQKDVLDGALSRLRERAAVPAVAGTSIEVREVDYCAPMEESVAGNALAATALDLAKQLGFEPGLAHTGGVSDANRVAALGVPTLDGLGPVGGGDHSPTEWLDLASVPRRVALLAALIHEASR
ncbi:M20 family metallopeptidase [Leucobacter viscericola]|uniref:M20 family metallopeptidase n=1 Tax=Leucobacter viscericola TaxID=2714935 RepID=A0A6G7XDF2_9MICO|nr:M20/M25/M40 family metallo-hydrolase [Leucobacter viscericola]QIK62624.1 M20 family metallopeptidase [Leucobacter viscericola]